MTPCESCPVRLASTSMSATVRASELSAPAARKTSNVSFRRNDASKTGIYGLLPDLNAFRVVAGHHFFFIKTLEAIKQSLAHIEIGITDQLLGNLGPEAVGRNQKVA